MLLLVLGPGEMTAFCGVEDFNFFTSLAGAGDADLRFRLGPFRGELVLGCSIFSVPSESIDGWLLSGVSLVDEDGEGVGDGTWLSPTAAASISDPNSRSLGQIGDTSPADGEPFIEAEGFTGDLGEVASLGCMNSRLVATGDADVVSLDFGASDAPEVTGFFSAGVDALVREVLAPLESIFSPISLGDLGRRVLLLISPADDVVGRTGDAPLLGPSKSTLDLVGVFTAAGVDGDLNPGSMKGAVLPC